VKARRAGEEEGSFVRRAGSPGNIPAGSCFNSYERLPFAPPLFAGQSRDPRSARARISCGILASAARVGRGRGRGRRRRRRRKGRITILPCSRGACTVAIPAGSDVKRGGGRGGKSSLDTLDESRFACLSALLLTRENREYR